MLECLPTLIQWHDGIEPYSLAINWSDGTLLIEYRAINDVHYTWPTNVIAGTQLHFQITDATGGMDVVNAEVTQEGMLYAPAVYTQDFY